MLGETTAVCAECRSVVAQDGYNPRHLTNPNYTTLPMNPFPCDEECCDPAASYCSSRCWAIAAIRVQRAIAKESGVFLPYARAKVRASIWHDARGFSLFVRIATKRLEQLNRRSQRLSTLRGFQ